MENYDSILFLQADKDIFADARTLQRIKKKLWLKYMKK